MSTQIPDPHDPASASDILMPPRWGENKCELSTFCTGLRHSSLAETTRVTSLRRYAAMGKIKHRFLLLEAIREGIRLCIRLDRYPGGQGNQKLLASTYSPADDSVRLSMIEEALVQKGDNREAVIDFDDPVPLNRFGRVFDVVRNESMFYTITKKNCWFFSSVIQELSILFFGGRFNQGAVLNHPELNKRCRKLIKNKLYDVLHVSTSIRDLESLVLAMHEKSLVGPVLRLLRIMKAQDRLLYCSSLSDSVAMQGVASCLERILSSWKDVVYEHLRACSGVPGTRKLGEGFPQALSQTLHLWEILISVDPERTTKILGTERLGALEQMLVQLFKAESTWASVRNEIQAYQFKPSADDYQPSNNQMRRSNTDIELAVRTLELLSSCQSTEDLARQQRFRLNQETTNLKARLACTLLESAQFACRSWSVLVCRVDCGDADVMQALEKFAESWLLHWVAAMGIMEELDAACLSLHRIEQWMRPCTDKKELRTYISDVCRFILRYKQALRQSSFFILNAPLPFSRSAGLNSVGSSSSNQPAPYSITLLTGVGHSWSQSPVQLRGHPGPVSSVAFSHDGDRIISTCRNNQIWIWNAAVGNLARTLDLDSTCIFAVFSPDGTQIACALEDNTKIYIFGANDMPGQPLRLHGHTNRVNSLSFSPYGFKLASASSDGTVRIWNCESGSSERILRGHTHPVVSVDYSRDGVLLASAGGWTVCLWDVLTGHMRFQVDLKSAVYSVSFTADNTQVLFAAVDGSVGLLQVDGNGEPQLVGQHRGAVYSVSCAPVGNYVVSGSADKSVCLWDVRSRTLVRTFNGHVSDIYSVAFSPDSERVVSGSQDGSVRIWDKPKARADMTTNSFVIAFSLDGKLTASTSEDKIIRINLRGSSHPPVLLRGHTDMVTCACFSSNGRNLTSGSRDLTVKLWDTNSGSCLIEMAIGDATQFRDFQWAPQAPYHIGYSLCNRVLCVRGWGIADKFGRSYTLYLNSKNLDDDPTHLPKAIFPSISVPDPFLPIILDQNCLCVRSRGALKYVCWLPDDFEPASEVIQIGRRVTVGGKGGEIIHVDFKEFDLKWL